MTLTNIQGATGNSVFGIPSPEEQQAAYQAVIDSVNADGGVACRKLVPRYFNGNPADGSDAQVKCLDIAQAGVFAVLDSGAYANLPQKDCFAEHHIPFFGNYFITEKQVTRDYPYVFEQGTYDALYRNTIFALRDRGFFSAAHGFKKLGFVYRSCDPEVISAMRGWLRRAGAASDQIVTYDVGCPSAFANPADIQQAVLTFQQEGVTHVTTAEFLADFPNFTKVAERQGFRPVYGLADDSLIAISYGSLRPDYTNIANAVAITNSRDGEEHTPGITHNPGTQKCNTIMRAHGLKPVHERPAAIGDVCNEVWTFKAAVENSPALAANALAAGLQRVGSIDYSFPWGPNDFTGPRVTVGGQFWRVTQFLPSCSCWRIVDRTFHPSYPA